jgi:hypothetical protein
MRVYALTKISQLLIIDEEGKDVASCIVWHSGPKFSMSDIRGRRFTEAWPPMWDWCVENGCEELSGYVTLAHSRLLRRAAKLLDGTLTIGPEVPHEMARGKMYCEVIFRKRLEVAPPAE